MSVNLGTTGSRLLDIGLPGMPADETDQFIDSFVNEAATGGIDTVGTIDFGVAVAHGTADNGCIPLSATDGSERILGITTRMPLFPAIPGGEIGYGTGRAVGIFRYGTTVAIAAEASREGDAVIGLPTVYSGTRGRSNLGAAQSGAANGTTRLAMTGHRWKTTTAQGELGIIEIASREIAVLTS